MGTKKFCMECAGELTLSADGAIGICAKCGKTYTFTPTVSAPTETAQKQTSVAEEYKSKVVALMNLEKKEEAVKTAEEFLEKHPDDYRAYLLRGSLEVNLYKLSPVDAVIDGNWSAFREKLEQAMKLATQEQLALIEQECGGYCKQAENVVQIFYDLHQIKKTESEPPVAPINPEQQLAFAFGQVREKISKSEHQLASFKSEREAIENSNEVEKLRNEPITAKGFFTKKRLMKARERLYVVMEEQKTFKLKKLTESIDKEEQTLSEAKAKLAELERKLEDRKPQYQEELASYEQELAAYKSALASREEKERLYAVDPTAQAILKKLVLIEKEIAECEREIERLDRQSQPITPASSSTVDYYLARAVNREREQRLTQEKIKITGKITDLRFKLIAAKPKATLFKD